MFELYKEKFMCLSVYKVCVMTSIVIIFIMQLQNTLMFTSVNFLLKD